jgi:hypothetical protein
MGQFCSRQPQACEVGSSALSYLGQKAVASAKWAYETLTTKGEQNAVAKAPRVIEMNGSQNTLTDADTALEWRGPQRSAEVKR